MSERPVSGEYENWKEQRLVFSDITAATLANISTKLTGKLTFVTCRHMTQVQF